MDSGKQHAEPNTGVEDDVAVWAGPNANIAEPKQDHEVLDEGDSEFEPERSYSISNASSSPVERVSDDSDDSSDEDECVR
jgi:hypothetical protein